MDHFDVLIIGAGPAGACCSSLLNKKGLKCLVIEKSVFPRFSIGESLLPQNMEFFESSGLDDVFNKHQFQYKDGALFIRGSIKKTIEFQDKFTTGPFSTFQVQRDIFDKLVTDKLVKDGVTIKFNHTVESIQFGQPTILEVKNHKNGQIHSTSSNFVVDASGFAKVVPRLLNLDVTHTAEKRYSIFSHIETERQCNFDTNKILIGVDENNPQTWFWVIPLSEKKYSLGVVSDEKLNIENNNQNLLNFLEKNPFIKNAIGNFTFLMEAKKIQNFSTFCEERIGQQWLLIGNSREFIDPIFSSGITVALKSATLASKIIPQILNNEKYDWQKDYFEELDYGVDTFRNFIQSWYQGELQSVIFNPTDNEQIKKMIVSVLAGYAWDRENPYTKNTLKRLNVLSKIVSS